MSLLFRISTELMSVSRGQSAVGLATFVYDCNRRGASHVNRAVTNKVASVKHFKCSKEIGVICMYC